MMDFVETLVLSFDVAPDLTRIGAITFANDAMVRFDLNTYGDSLDVVDALMSFRRQRGGTNTGDALRLLREHSFQVSNGARPGILKVAIIITDGKSRDTDNTLRQAAIDRSQGHILFAVGVGKNLDLDELQGIAGLQWPDRFLSAESFEALVELNDKILKTTCDGEARCVRDERLYIALLRFDLSSRTHEISIAFDFCLYYAIGTVVSDKKSFKSHISY